MAQQQFPSAGAYGENHKDLLRRVLDNLHIIMQGKTNNTHEVTLTESVATTDVPLTKGDLTPTTVINFMPITANAATEFGAGTMYVSLVNADAVSSGTLAKYSFRITHVNNAQTDRTFRYTLTG